MMKEVKGFNKYKVNESGIVINKKGHPLRTALSNSGYLRTALEENDSNHRINKSIHRIVAETFIPNPDNLPVVMHIDNDTLNNHVSNLKWGTQAENIKQSFLEGRKVSPKNNSSYVYTLVDLSLCSFKISSIIRSLTSTETISSSLPRISITFNDNL